jgi:hypothetical protein
MPLNCNIHMQNDNWPADLGVPYIQTNPYSVFVCTRWEISHYPVVVIRFSIFCLPKGSQKAYIWLSSNNSSVNHFCGRFKCRCTLYQLYPIIPQLIAWQISHPLLRMLFASSLPLLVHSTLIWLIWHRKLLRLTHS